MLLLPGCCTRCQPQSDLWEQSWMKGHPQPLTLRPQVPCMYVDLPFAHGELWPVSDRPLGELTQDLVWTKSLFAFMFVYIAREKVSMSTVLIWIILEAGWINNGHVKFNKPLPKRIWLLSAIHPSNDPVNSGLWVTAWEGRQSIGVWKCENCSNHHKYVYRRAGGRYNSVCSH